MFDRFHVTGQGRLDAGDTILYLSGSNTVERATTDSNIGPYSPRHGRPHANHYWSRSKYGGKKYNLTDCFFLESIEQ